MKKILCIIIALTSLFTSCVTTLQQDVLQTSNLNKELRQEIAIYEDRFILIDAEFLKSAKIDAEEVESFHQDIADKASQSHLEPIVKAHITAIDGLLYLLEGKKKKAENAYMDAKAVTGGDDYVMLLASKLQKTEKDSLSFCDEILSVDANNSIITMAKGVLLYNAGEYDKAVALIDQAFIQFDNQGRNNYRTVYNDFRDKVWTLYSTGISSEKGSEDLTKELSKEDMVFLAYAKSSALTDLTRGTKLNKNQLYNKVFAAGLFNAAKDSENLQNSAALITDSQSINRLACARFLWNLYVLNKGNPQLASRYTSRYSKIPNAKSPVSDIEIQNLDFDAVLGVVDNEIMNLPDGKNFKPSDKVRILDYLTFLKKFNK
ncbi:MAG: hypothetical protein K6F15_02080 [Treponema sp.]|nr:hypothetical protein [Treponema sp.]